MTREELRQLLVLLKEYYPNSFSNHTAEGSQLFFSIWLETFKDEDARLVQAATLKCIQQNLTNFAPTIGQIRQMMKEIAGVKPMDADEAWKQVRHIWSNLASDNPSEISAEYDSLPQSVKRIYSPADLIELAFHTTSHDIEAYEKPRFMNMYKSIATQETDMLLTHKTITQVAIETKGYLMIGDGK